MIIWCVCRAATVLQTPFTNLAQTSAQSAPKHGHFRQRSHYRTAYHHSVWSDCFGEKRGRISEYHRPCVKTRFDRTNGNLVRATLILRFEIVCYGACWKHAILITPYKFNNSNKNKQEQLKQLYINILHTESCFLVFAHMIFFDYFCTLFVPRIEIYSIFADDLKVNVYGKETVSESQGAGENQIQGTGERE